MKIYVYSGFIYIYIPPCHQSMPRLARKVSYTQQMEEAIADAYYTYFHSKECIWVFSEDTDKTKEEAEAYEAFLLEEQDAAAKGEEEWRAMVRNDWDIILAQENKLHERAYWAEQNARWAAELYDDIYTDY